MLILREETLKLLRDEDLWKTLFVVNYAFLGMFLHSGTLPLSQTHWQHMEKALNSNQNAAKSSTNQ
jgi:hypothetical protein